MSEEGAKLERDNTMVATAKEGEAYIEAKGGVDEDAKTRAQQKEIEDITAKEQSELKRTTTMAETAKEGKDLLDGEELGKTRAQTKAEKNGDADTTAPEENGDGKEGEENGKEAEAGEDSTANGDETEEADKAAVKRTHTMEDTLKEGEEFLKKQKVDENDSEEVKA